MRKVHLYVDGMVLAVGFRAYVKRVADSRKLRGYVRNMEGGVEVVAEGEHEDIEYLIEACKKGPSAASVSEVTVEEEVPNFIFKDFEIKP